MGVNLNMRCYKIKEKILAVKGTNFSIYDETDEVVFNAHQNAFTAGFDAFFGSFFSIKCRTTIETIDGNVVCVLVKRPSFIWQTYDIYHDDEIVATIKREKNWWKPVFNVEGKYGSFSFAGDVFARKFDIVKDGIIYAKVRKHDFQMSDTYHISVLNNDKDFLYISIALAIDNCFFHN